MRTALVALAGLSLASLASPPQGGITCTTLLENSEVRVVRVRFAPGSREPVHTHPNDLLTIQMCAGSVVIQTGGELATGALEVGYAYFVPRDTSHAYRSTDSRPFDIFSILFM